MDELTKYYTDLREDINAELLANLNEGANTVTIFTEKALEILKDVEEVEYFMLCHDEKHGRIAGNDYIEHRINAFSISDNSDTLNLFITHYNDSETILTLTKTEIDRLLKQVLNFFKNSRFLRYHEEIAPSAEAYQFCYELFHSSELKHNLSRLCLTILTNSSYKQKPLITEDIAGITSVVKVVDINYLFNLDGKERSPIEIGLDHLEDPLPCIGSGFVDSNYQSYLAIIPGKVLASVYALHGLRLLEQNVRSFLQFTTKVNKGIRTTIMNTPHMFLAYNNGISATADKVSFQNLPGGGKGIIHIHDFQIVNGGQTTSSIYQMWRISPKLVSDIYVPMKLTILERDNHFSNIVGKIAEYANTQNKISASDLSSNRESLVKLEQISRNTWAPPKEGSSIQTRWFFERARGQYKNERARFGNTLARKTQFDNQNPKSQMIKKEDIAKYINTCQEVIKNSKIIIGPHIVVRGNEKNFAQYLLNNFPENVDQQYFQDVVARAILFETAKDVYGVKPHALGDLRFVTVPYTIAYIAYKTERRLNLRSIWQAQKIDNNFRELLKTLMMEIEKFIKDSATGSLYVQWAKEEKCWSDLKKVNVDFDFDLLESYCISTEEAAKLETENDEHGKLLGRINDIGFEGWNNIQNWMHSERHYSASDRALVNTICSKLSQKSKLNSGEINRVQRLFDKMEEHDDYLEVIIN